MFIFLKGRLWVLCSHSLDISQITTGTSTEPSPILLEDDNDIEGLKEQKKMMTVEYTKKKFITSEDIDVHRKVDLQDGDITEEQQNAFKELCGEYRDIFLLLKNSCDLWNSTLVVVED